MSYGQQQGPQSQWDPWKPHSQQQPWGSSGDDGTPDWAALAEASETRNKRRRLLFIGGGALATIAIGSAVAMAVVSANGSKGSEKPSSLPAGGIPSASGTAAPSFAPTSAPPPLDPKDFVSSKNKDKAPIGPAILFPNTQLALGSTAYKKGASADTTNCGSATKGTLPKILGANDCTRLMRVTYAEKNIAGTVGVALFDTAAQATKAKSQWDKKSVIASLSGKGVGAFCNSAICYTTANSYGRYAYFTVTGFTDGKDVTDKNTAVFTAGDGLAEYAFNQIRRRGEAQASAAANAG
ncbi:hypothetical protein SLINC_5071 [Streptomyces lincolnensis]|uniref:Uncharacterized protein n=1 Tax=Streptomyces lincolnensis TaxID=1915 RepID=A0A1B1MF88_STRLN|nr:hypothetical protein [Streptomyces lincolnensis]ANS67295.1 hypothetical protein SLINC_5071 [Streptomyces lincolnensis]AXG56166.1 hypothetical protein SLCG_5011 [Streptomyces lincolnensis]QMV07370.1 hypothetical protein GJU35_17940 [Streptomyces lincolnensis]